MDAWIPQLLAALGGWAPPVLVVAFLAGSVLILWRLEVLSGRGVEGTVLGTLFMPYFSGLGNLLFVAVMIRQQGPPQEVLVNAVVNNGTNLCLLLGLPALLFGLSLKPASKARKAVRAAAIHRLALALTLLAAGIFAGLVWLLSRDGSLDRFDGLALIVVFLFWQAFHVYEVRKEQTRTGTGWSPWIVWDLALILIGSGTLLVSVDGLVSWLLAQEGGWLGPETLGLVTGLLMVLPNAILAFYYAIRGRADVVYSSQVGDGHICVPLCLGIFAVATPIPVAAPWDRSLLILCGLAAFHLLAITLFNGLPRWLAPVLLVAFGVWAWG